MRLPPDRQVLVQPSWLPRHGVRGTGSDPGDLQALGRQRLGGRTVATWRRALRRELAHRLPGLDPARRWIVLGHQPLPMHPGIWFKRFLACELACRRGGQVLVVQLDLEPAGEVPWPVVSHETVRSASFELPPFFFHMLGREELVQKLERLELPAALLDLELPDRSPAWTGLQALLRRWEGGHPGHLWELGQSELVQTAAMQEVVLSLLADPKALHHRYNELLAVYRREHRIRNPANPFPDLGGAGDTMELPLWRYDGQGRETVRLADPGPPLVPKGSLLGALKRLLVADLYVHGVGAAIYEPFADLLFGRLWGLHLPGYITASASLGVDGGRCIKATRQLERLREMERDLRHNPDRLLPEAGLAGDAELQGALARRRQAQELLERAGPKERGQLVGTIQTCNEALRQRLAPWWRRQLEQRDELQEMHHRLAPLARRDLPVFYHDPGELCASFTDLLDSVTLPAW